MTKFTLASVVRVSTAGGEALFTDSSGVVRGNDVGRAWLNLKEGTEVELCAAFPQTHTWMAVISVTGEDGSVTQKSAIFRKDSWDKLVAASQE